jgi:hypothetical protein
MTESDEPTTDSLAQLCVVLGRVYKTLMPKRSALVPKTMFSRIDGVGGERPEGIVQLVGSASAGPPSEIFPPDPMFSRQEYESIAEAVADVEKPRPMKALIDGAIEVADLKRRLALGGLDCYPDASGATFIRRTDAAEAQRALIRQQRIEQLERIKKHTDAVREEGERNYPTKPGEHR